MYVTDLGMVEYDRAWELQRLIREKKITSEFPDFIIFLEHYPVITIGRNGAPSNILGDPDELSKSGIAVRRVDRGGDVTYHGPGQLVCYPVIDLRLRRFSVVGYVAGLEEVMIRTLEDVGVKAFRDPGGRRGVWCNKGKIGSVGISLKRWVSNHGFALNYNLNKAHVEKIVPCGLRGERMISVVDVLGKIIEREDLVSRAVVRFADVFNVEMVWHDASELLSFLNVKEDYYRS